MTRLRGAYILKADKLASCELVQWFEQNNSSLVDELTRKFMPLAQFTRATTTICLYDFLWMNHKQLRPRTSAVEVGRASYTEWWDISVQP
jgi:hypothetical protein